jgi:NADH:ubiquinone oxidoreductase subunit 2 (subunit N)
MIVAMLSLTGIPLTAGFLGKLFVFYGAIAGGWTWLAVVAAVGSVVSFGYYGRVIQAMYFASPEPRDPAGAQEDAASDAPVGPVRVWPFALLAGVLLLAGTVPLATGFEWLLRAFAV